MSTTILGSPESELERKSADLREAARRVIFHAGLPHTTKSLEDLRAACAAVVALVDAIEQMLRHAP